VSAKERLNLVVSRLAEIDPAARVTRSVRELDHDKHTENGSRIYAVVSAGFPKFAANIPRPAEDAQHEIIILAQQKCLDTATGEQIEDVELEMLDKVKALAQDGFDDMCLLLKSAKGSVQQDHPYAMQACFLMFDDL
jgi:hypothetical protein|tara:strand:- start:446 stop:856 length:411 start_codon:yes stop_codon:yes gene_type:complete